MNLDRRFGDRQPPRYDLVRFTANEPLQYLELAIRKIGFTERNPHLAGHVFRLEQRKVKEHLRGDHLLPEGDELEHLAQALAGRVLADIAVDTNLEGVCHSLALTIGCKDDDLAVRPVRVEEAAGFEAFLLRHRVDDHDRDDIGPHHERLQVEAMVIAMDTDDLEGLFDQDTAKTFALYLVLANDSDVKLFVHRRPPLLS